MPNPYSSERHCNFEILKLLTFQSNHVLVISREDIGGGKMQEVCWTCEGRIDFSNRNPFYRCFCEDCAKTLDADYKMAAFEAFRVGVSKEAFLKRWSNALS